MPRKPARNGMLMWTMATFVEHPSILNQKLPYFIELVPHLKPNDGGGAYAVEIMMKRWRFANKPHIVTDSGFGSFPLIKKIIQWGGFATMSIPSGETQNLTPFIAHNLPLNRWRACINEQGIILAIRTQHIESENGSTSIGRKCVITNAYKAISIPMGIVDMVSTSFSKITIFNF